MRVFDAQGLGRRLRKTLSSRVVLRTIPQFLMKSTSECSSGDSRGEAKIARDRTLLEKNSPVSHPSSGMRPLKFSPRVPCHDSCLKLRPQNDLGHRAAGALPFPTDFNQNKNEETKL
jgi:hypothetical protein